MHHLPGLPPRYYSEDAHFEAGRSIHQCPRHLIHLATDGFAMPRRGTTLAELLADWDVSMVQLLQIHINLEAFNEKHFPIHLKHLYPHLKHYKAASDSCKPQAPEVVQYCI